jgi:hypothetical protein
MARRYPAAEVVVLASAIGDEPSTTYLDVPGTRTRVRVVRTNDILPPSDNYNLAAHPGSRDRAALQALVEHELSNATRLIGHEVHVDAKFSADIAGVLRARRDRGRQLPSALFVHTPDRVETDALGVVDVLKNLRAAGAQLVSVSPKGIIDMRHQGIIGANDNVPVISAGVSRDTFARTEEHVQFPLPAALRAIARARVTGVGPEDIDITTGNGERPAAVIRGVRHELQPDEFIWAERFAGSDLGIIAGHLDAGRFVVLNPAARPTFAKGVQQKSQMRALADEVVRRTNGHGTVVFGRLTADDVVTACKMVAVARQGVFVTASRREGRPLAVLDALAAGLPVTGSKIPGHDDLPGVWIPVREEFGLRTDTHQARRAATQESEELARGVTTAMNAGPDVIARGKASAASFLITHEAERTSRMIGLPAVATPTLGKVESASVVH